MSKTIKNINLNPELEDVYLTFLKYPYITSDDLDNMFVSLIQNKEVSKEKQKDIRKCLNVLRDRLDYIIKNDFDI